MARFKVVIELDMDDSFGVGAVEKLFRNSVREYDPKAKVRAGNVGPRPGPWREVDDIRIPGQEALRSGHRREHGTYKAEVFQISAFKYKARVVFQGRTIWNREMVNVIDAKGLATKKLKAAFENLI